MSGEAYFLYHSIGQYPGKAEDIAKAMADFARVWGAADDAQWGDLLGKRAAFIERWRAIIGAPVGSVTTCENVTQGLHMLVTALDPARLRGKRVLIAADCFPSNHFLLKALEARLGFALETVPLRPGAHWVEDEDFLARWGGDIALAFVNWVSSTTSHRADLAVMAARARETGALIGIDITQAAGLLPFSVNAPACDFAVSTSLKWMCGTPGAGMLYVKPELISECAPELRGWFSQANPFSWDLDKFALAPDIRRFDNGTPGIMAAIASLPALTWHAAQDHATLLTHNRALSARIIAAAQDRGLQLISPLAADQRGGSVMIKLPDHLPAPKVLDTFRKSGIYADARGQILRLSPGAMTTDAGTTTLIAALNSLAP